MAVITLFLVIFVLATLYRKISIFLRAQYFRRTYGCAPTRHADQHPLAFGLDIMSSMKEAANENRLLDQLEQWHLKYGSTFELNLANQATIVTSNPQNVQAILAVRFQHFELGWRRRRNLKPLLGSGIFATDGIHWSRARGILRPSFSRRQIADLSMVQTHVNHLINAILHQGGSVDLQDLFFRLTLDSATEFLLGESVDTLTQNDTAAVEFGRSFDYAMECVSRRGMMGMFFLLYRNPAFNHACAYVREYASRYVQKSLENHDKDEGQETGERRYVFLQELVKETQDSQELTDQVLNVLLAGRDTTAILLSNTFFVLARRPDIYEKLRAHVLDSGDAYQSFEGLKSMKYLQFVLNEVLRLYPVVPLNTRIANQDTFLPCGGGPNGDKPIFVAKGQTVLYNTYSMHRSKEMWGEDAEEFMPERWTKHTRTWEYIPFSAGPRICIGQQYALTEAAFVVASLLRKFKEIRSRDSLPWTEKYGIACAIQNGVQVDMIPV